MSIQHVNMISNRLSLRKPQRDSLKILHRICEIATLKKDAELQAMLEVVQSEFPHVKSFDREFFSLCFALATGVGKTRLMGAFISYLYLSEGIRHFMVISPNLTIYNKLITDFTPNTSKYVFKGIGEFAQNPPVIVTGDNYESGVGVRGSMLSEFYKNEVHINIFNISKITDKGLTGSNLAQDDVKRTVPRMRRLSEYIGESYFDYLSGLDDLVILMDESHRYRASAGMQALNDLKPILGLELTATPQVERGQSSTSFDNVIYNYPLSAAMDDGYVKEPAVATRENFDASNYSEDGLEKVKLEDGVRIHENTKVELEVFSRNNDLPYVKPFLLVVARDTNHANELQTHIQSEEFFEGRYRDKVITVHSNTTGQEKDEVVQQLLTVEDPDNPVEIVIHVNMLKEGWDVTNLYTIVPLRAANSRTLVEQSIGRGLRLPYGKRVGIPAVDRLTIVSHDRFQEIVDHANDPNSIIRVGVIIGKDIPEEGRKAVQTKPKLERIIAQAPTPTPKPGSGEAKTSAEPEKAPGPIFKTKEEQEYAKIAIEVIGQYERLKGSHELETEGIQKEMANKVKRIIGPTQATLDPKDQPDVAEVVEKATKLFREMTIDIPKIVVTPAGEVTCRYEDFELNLSGVNLQPVSQDILIKHLHDQRVKYTIQSGNALVEENRPEDYIVRGLIDFDDISYDDHADTLYKLASQVVTHLKGYLKDDNEVLNVLQYNQQTLAKLVHAQMQEHFIEEATRYETNVTKGFTTLKANNYTIAEDENVRDFRVAIPDGQKQQIKSMIFGGFEKCLYPEQKFDSDPERRFAVILEEDKTVLKWFKPAKGAFPIYYTSKDSYEPDFVVETKAAKFLCEPKQSNQMTDKTVLMKAKAAATWCQQATEHANDTDGKHWNYLLIPHDKISDDKTLDGLASTYCLSTNSFM
jgi:type III restriction enzyme